MPWKFLTPADVAEIKHLLNQARKVETKNSAKDARLNDLRKLKLDLENQLTHELESKKPDAKSLEKRASLRAQIEEMKSVLPSEDSELDGISGEGYKKLYEQFFPTYYRIRNAFAEVELKRVAKILAPLFFQKGRGVVEAKKTDYVFQTYTPNALSNGYGAYEQHLRLLKKHFEEMLANEDFVFFKINPEETSV